MEVRVGVEDAQPGVWPWVDTTGVVTGVVVEGSPDFDQTALLPAMASYEALEVDRVECFLGAVIVDGRRARRDADPGARAAHGARRGGHSVVDGAFLARLLLSSRHSLINNSSNRPDLPLTGADLVREFISGVLASRPPPGLGFVCHWAVLLRFGPVHGFPVRILRE